MSDLKSILLIDANARDRQHYADVVKAVLPDALVLEAEDGRTGLSTFRSRSIDAVVLEFSLPDMSGFEVLKQLACLEGIPHIPIIVLTRLTYATIMAIAKENGAHAAFIKKSTTDQMFQDAVFNALYPSRRVQPTMGF